MSESAFQFSATTDLSGMDFETARQLLLRPRPGRRDAIEDTPEQLILQTDVGRLNLRNDASARPSLTAMASSELSLFTLKSAVLREMNMQNAETADGLRWSDQAKGNSLPPNFRFVHVAEIVAVGTAFLRVTLEADDLSHHGDKSIHFRLVQPPLGAEPQWPTVAENGSIQWPKGDDAPHKPVYTTRFLDLEKQQIVTDIFIHDGGRTYEWAKGVAAGTDNRTTLGLPGPAGGGLLYADRVLMASDETGFPAAARLLENLPEDASGHLLLEAENGAACNYPIHAPPGIRVSWLSRNDGEQLARATIEAMQDFAGDALWFVGEKSQAADVRAQAKLDGWPNDKLRISGFWTRS